MSPSIDLLANNGTVGGGEVMMVALAVAARELGVGVRIVAPAHPDETLALARSESLDSLAIPSSDRRSYLLGLAARRRRLTGDLWWCNGLVPALATSLTGHGRVVHLHQEPLGPHRGYWSLARSGARQIFVPSASMRQRIPGSTVLENWTEALEQVAPRGPAGPGPFRIGFIGRFSTIKGLDVLARAMQRLDRTVARPLRLVLAGDGRFVDARDSASVEMELDRVRDVQRLGWVDRRAFFDSVDLVVVPSVWAEPFGLVAAEAMACGRAVMVSDAGALPEVVGPEHPWVVRAADEVDLARSIRRFLEVSGEVIAAQVEASRARWESEFSPDAGRARVADALAGLGLLDGVTRPIVAS